MSTETSAPGHLGTRAPGHSLLKWLAAFSAIYDIAVGAALLFFRETLQAWFALPAPQPPIHADLNALFVIVIGIGYVLPYRDPVRYRAYLWLMNPLLKGAGCVAFLLDYVLRGSPASFLLFAAGDGTLAIVTLVALLRTRHGAAETQGT